MLTHVRQACWDTLETYFQLLRVQATVGGLLNVQATVGGLDDAVSHVHAVLEQREDLGRWVEESGRIEYLRKFYHVLRIAEKPI